jgi:hypothetical protein
MEPWVRLVLASILIGTVGTGCGPFVSGSFAEPLQPIGQETPTPIGGGVGQPDLRPDTCDTFFADFFYRIHHNGSWTASYARAQWIAAMVHSVRGDGTTLGSPRHAVVSIEIHYTAADGSTAIETLLINRSPEIQESNTEGPSGPLKDLRCKAVGRTGWLVQGFYYIGTNDLTQYAISLAFDPGTVG